MLPPYLTGSRAIFFSPHLDDAVLSVGGTLAERAARELASTVVTVFAGVPSPPYSEFAAAFHVSCGLEADPVQARIGEDRSALASLGAQPSYAGLFDAIYRTAGGTWLYDGVGRTFAPPPDGDKPIRAETERLVLDIVRDERPDVILGPAALGDHVDHILVAEAVRHAATVTGTPAFFWEDIPYAVQKAPDRSSPCLLSSIARDSWQARLAAAAQYRSQITMLFPPTYDWQTALTAYASSFSGSPVERLWCSNCVSGQPVGYCRQYS